MLRASRQVATENNGHGQERIVEAAKGKSCVRKAKV